MREAVIVSAACKAIGRVCRGAFNNTEGQSVAGHVISHAVQRAGGRKRVPIMVGEVDVSKE